MLPKLVIYDLVLLLLKKMSENNRLSSENLCGILSDSNKTRIKNQFVTKNDIVKSDDILNFGS